MNRWTGLWAASTSRLFSLKCCTHATKHLASVRLAMRDAVRLSKHRTCFRSATPIAHPSNPRALTFDKEEAKRRSQNS